MRNMTSKKNLLFALATGAVAMAFVLLAWNTTPPAPGPETAPCDEPEDCVPARPGAAASAGDGARQAVDTWPGPYAAPVGRRLTFAAETVATSSLRPKAEGQPAQEVCLSARGQVACTVLARRERDLIFAMQWIRPEVRGEAGGGTASPATLASDLERPLFVRARCSGAITGVRFAAETTAASRSFLRALIAASRFVVTEGDAAAWSCEEDDPTGVARVDYQRRATDAAAFALTRTCTSYRGATGMPLSSVAAKGEARFVGEHGWYAHAHHAARLGADIEEVNARIEVAFTLDLTLAGTEDLAKDSLPRVDWDGAWEDLRGGDDARAGGDEILRARRERELAGQTVASLVVELVDLLRNQGIEAHDTFTRRAALVDLLRLRPDALPELAAELARQDLEPKLKALLLGVAGAVGTEAAQVLCNAFVTDPTQHVDLRVAGLHALFQLDAPAAQTRETVLQVAGDPSVPLPVAGTALLLLGTYASRGPDAAFADLLAKEQPARDRGLIHDWLSALGNAGRSEVVDAVAGYLQAEDSQLRAAAVGALRRVTDVRAEQALLARLEQDADAGVRAVAAEQLAERGTAAALTAVERCLVGADDGLRAAIRRGVERGPRTPRSDALRQRCGQS